MGRSFFGMVPGVGRDAVWVTRGPGVLLGKRVPSLTELCAPPGAHSGLTPWANE